MITVHISGGLGNQLFQYAAGLATASRLGSGLCLDARKFAKASAADDPAARPLRILELDLPLREICTPDDEKIMRQSWNLAKNLHLPKSWLGFHTDTHHRFSPRFHHLQDGARLQGYFQSEMYFAQIATDVRRAFQPRNKDLLGKIDAQLAEFRRDHRPLVSLHVRRGDFLQITGYEALTDEKFLHAAMAEFAGAHFLILSDDPAWCRSHFTNRDDVSFSPFTSVLDDFFAMARCDHNILAKSTFSWWAAWLNESKGRRIIAPKIPIEAKPKWGGASPDYYPADWTLL